MSENIQLEIKNIGPIHEANIDLGKLNIIGGAIQLVNPHQAVFSIAFCFQHQRREKTTMMAWWVLKNHKWEIPAVLK